RIQFCKKFLHVILVEPSGSVPFFLKGKQSRAHLGARKERAGRSCPALKFRNERWEQFGVCGPQNFSLWIAYLNRRGGSADQLNLFLGQFDLANEFSSQLGNSIDRAGNAFHLFVA